MSKIVRYQHHTAEKVSVQEHLKGKHRDHCLCFQNCKNFKPDKDDNCPIAQLLYKLCIDCNIVIPVWECPKYAEEK